MSSAPYAQRVARPNGWWGMAVFVATEATLFGTLIGSYFDLRFKSVHWPPGGIPEPKVVLPVILTAVLVSMSAPMQLAFVFAKRGLLASARIALLVALLVQAGYLGLQIHLYVDDLHRFSPDRTAYGSIYFTLVGAHHAHVLVGIVLSLWLILRLSGGLTAYRLAGLQSLTFYWHFVNVLAVIVTTVQLSPSI